MRLNVSTYNCLGFILTDGQEKAIISDGLSSVAPLTDERCNYNVMIEFMTIRKLQRNLFL